METIEQRKERLLKYFKESKAWVIYVVLALITLIGTYIRTRNIWLFQGYKYIPDVDSYLFVRYAQYIVEHGKLMAVDMMRYVPLGANTGNEPVILAYVMAYMYKFFSIFNPNITMMHVAAWYPPIFFALGLIVFFFLVKKLFDWRIALFSSALLTIVPAYLYRTMAGVSDKEPLGMLLMFLAWYLYVLAWKSDNLKKAIAFGVLSGISTGLLALAWGGVGFVTLVISLFLLVELFLSKVTRQDFYIYLAWIVPLFLFAATSPKHGGIQTMLTNFVFNIPLFVFIALLSNYLFFEKNLFNLRARLKDKIPFGIFNFAVAVGLIIISATIIFGPTFLFTYASDTLSAFMHPLGTSRFELTVAEAQRPHVDDWLSGSAFGLSRPYLSWIYFAMFFFGSILLFYNFIKPLHQYKYKLTALYTIFITSFIFSNYSSSSILNGQTLLAKFMYLGSLILFIVILAYGYIHSFYKRKDLFNEILKLDRTYTFIFIWYLLMIVGAMGGLRLFFVFAPITTVLASYLIAGSVDYLLNLKDNKHRIALIGILVVVTYLVFSSFFMITYNSSKYTGLGYDVQWQNAEKWVKANTKENAVFSHWWDYGYWIQTGFNRATVLDGGNYIVYWDHLFGRHVLTGSNVTRALEFLKTHKANYLLVDPSDIGKYPAYASIGGDEDYDRLSQIPIMGLDQNQVQETRNETVYLYRGGFGLDDDLVYDNSVFPKNRAGILGIFLPLVQYNNTTPIEIRQPIAVLAYNNQQYRMPMECVYFNGREYNFENAVLKGCLRIIPTIQDNQMNVIGAAYYLSEKVRKTFFAQLYLLNNQNMPAFKLVYSDENDYPLAVYNGRPIGPMRIWEIGYPAGIKENPDDLKTEFPDPKLYMTNL
ncbi:MAG: STT3 domain-containing protein [Nanoarchaeota archaeon]